MGKRLITAEMVVAAHGAGQGRLSAPRRQAVVSPEAWSTASALGLVIDQSDEPLPPAPPKGPGDPGSCERIVDPSGLVVVRGRSVRLGLFTGAGPEHRIGLTDLVTGADRSPMTAGIMSWGREDSFPWALDYDEIDYVLEGVLQLTIDGRTLEGRTGDVFYIPKGSRIIFGTPSRTRVFYVTYPANWAGQPPT